MTLSHERHRQSGEVLYSIWVIKAYTISKVCLELWLQDWGLGPLWLHIQGFDRNCMVQLTTARI